MKLRTELVLVVLAALAGGMNLHAQVQVTLPAPIVRETFDSVAEGKLPDGWSVSNFTDEGTPGEDLNDPGSDSYKNWVVLSRTRVQELGLAGTWDAAKRLAVAPNQSVNGVLVTNLIEGNLIYAESDVRRGSQVQFLFSPDFNLTGQSNVFLVFNSIYEQNEDSLGAVEYSVDEGKTWWPVVYMLERADIVRTADGAIDGFATLNALNFDAAALLDPATGEDVGHRYGAFLGVTSNRWSSLGPFISPRINDDPVESKRVELFRLSQADNQAKVRFRFAQAGTGSWYFGIDNFGLYSLAQSKPSRPALTVAPNVSFLAATAFSGSPFKGTAPNQTHGQSLWQISAFPSFAPETGLANVLESYVSAKDLTSLTVLLRRVRPGKTYYATVQYKDQTAAASDFAEPAAFTVMASLPSPIAFEDFESTPEGAVPKGWTVENQTDGGGVGENTMDLGSDTYLNWTVTSSETLAFFGANRVNDTNVVSGKSIYANSDFRVGNQIQYLTTPLFDLTGKTNIWLSFKSNYMQNQDSLGGLEYSIDGGTTWLPLLYMIDQSDVFYRADGTVDAAKTLSTTYSDVARVIDAAGGNRVAVGKYGDFVLAKPLDSLGPFISGRVADDPLESKRIERFRLAAADNQPKVRCRFAHAGTDSWFWGVDDFALYGSSPVATVPPTLTASRQGNNLVVSWTGSGILQSSDNVTGPWSDVADATNPQTIPPSGLRKFYRVRPSDSGTGAVTTAPSLTTGRQGNNLVVSWTGKGTLQSSDNVTGPWADMTGATSPQTITPSGLRKFYRVRQ